LAIVTDLTVINLPAKLGVVMAYSGRNALSKGPSEQDSYQWELGIV